MNPRILPLIPFSLAIAVSAAPSQAFTGGPLTLREAVALVLARNPALVESGQAVDASRARADQSRSGYLPSAAIEGSYIFLAPVSVFSLPGEDIKVFPYSNYDGHLGLRQTLYDFQKTSSQVDLATSRIALAEDSREIMRRDLGFRTAEVFYAILFLRRSIEVQREQVRTLQEHLATTRRKIEGGTATQLDALTTQVRVAAAENLQVNLENSLRGAEITLRRLAALHADASLDLRGEFMPSSLPSNRDSLVQKALTGRIEAKAADDAVATALAQQRNAGRNDAPSLNASVLYGLKNGYIPNLDVLRGNLVLGVDFRFPVFDGNLTRGLEEEASANLRAAESRKQDVALSIEADVQQALSELRAATERVGISEVNINEADLAVTNARLRYEAGTIPNLDLLDAETAVAQARLTNLQALYDAVIGAQRLQRATGSMVPFQQNGSTE